MHHSPSLDLTGVTTLLCDADGTLFPSEEPAYAASAVVTRAFAERYALTGDFSAEGLRRAGTGRNFRSLTTDLLADAGIAAAPEELAEWIERERVAVTGHLADTLRPDHDLIAVADDLLGQYRGAVVSSSATPRLLACLAATGLADVFPPTVVFSAEDSLPTPVSKPDPTIYRHAMESLGVRADESVALEDSTTGVRSAVAAGIATIGVVCYVPPDERAERVSGLLAAGAALVVSTWDELRDVLLAERVV